MKTLPAIRRRRAVRMLKRIPAMLLFVAVLACALLSSSCTTTQFKTTLPDGRIIEAKNTSCLWDRQPKGFKFNYELGILEVESFDTNPDKASIKELCDTIKALSAAKGLMP